MEQSDISSFARLKKDADALVVSLYGLVDDRLGEKNMEKYSASDRRLISDMLELISAIKVFTATYENAGRLE